MSEGKESRKVMFWLIKKNSREINMRTVENILIQWCGWVPVTVETSYLEGVKMFGITL